jgi:hypothetical protein
MITTGQDKLFHLVYEKNKVKQKGLDPHLWSYRQRVSLEHLGQTLQDVTLKGKCPILHEFLRVVSIRLSGRSVHAGIVVSHVVCSQLFHLLCALHALHAVAGLLGFKASLRHMHSDSRTPSISPLTESWRQLEISLI